VGTFNRRNLNISAALMAVLAPRQSNCSPRAAPDPGNRFGERLVMSRRDVRISIVAEHAVVPDLAAEAFVIGAVVARVHGPVAALFGVPGKRQFDQRVAKCPVQVGARVGAGPYDEVSIWWRR
jgi:hypothetical protein